MTEKLKGISGSMFAGKSDRLIDIAEREGYKKHTVIAFKPAIDNRWSNDHIVSRGKTGTEIRTYPAYAVSSSIEILETIKNFLDTNPKIDLIIIDEAQFFDEHIVEVIKIIVEMDIPVTFSGLALDFRGEPFGQMPTLLSLCDEIEKPTAICKTCGEDATRTQRLINGKPASYTDPIILVGDQEEGYEARCVKHHEVPGKPKPSISR